jgi:glycosyltransferase involved in cell wall biosynthesis
MKIAIDGTSAYYGRGGVGRVTRHLIEALAGIDSTNEYTLYYDLGYGHPGSFPEVRSVNFRRAVNRLPRAITRRLSLPVNLRIGRPDVFHAPAFLHRVKRARSTVVTVHDLAYTLYPDLVPESIRRQLERHLAGCLESATRVVVPSRLVKGQVCETFGLPESRVDVVHWGPGDEYLDPPGLDRSTEVVKRWGLAPGFVLHVGTLDRRKNVEGLVRAFGTLKGTLGTDRTLVLIGREETAAPGVHEAIGQLNLENDIRILQDVPNRDVIHFHRSAALLACVSFYEGFGIPPLEALACGTPVVSTKIPSMTEIIGDYPLYVDPESEENIAEKLAEGLTNDELRRNCLALAGEKPRERSFPNIARETLDVYKRAAP